MKTIVKGIIIELTQDQINHVENSLNLINNSKKGFIKALESLGFVWDGMNKDCYLHHDYDLWVKIFEEKCKFYAWLPWTGDRRWGTVFGCPKEMINEIGEEIKRLENNGK